MTLAKAAVTGIVYKEPKTGYTQNDIEVSSFVLNVGEDSETLVRVISKRQALSSVVKQLAKNRKVLVGGRLQTGISKLDDGSDKKVFEIEASSIEIISEASNQNTVSQDNGSDIMTFGEMEKPSGDADVLIDGEEIPF